MYYVVYLLDIGVNIVVPVQWIHQYEVQMEKFVNKGLNPCQKHSVFYTEIPDAYTDEGIPIANYENISFDLFAEVFPDEGLYEGKLIKYFGNYPTSFILSYNFGPNCVSIRMISYLIQQTIKMPSNTHEIAESVTQLYTTSIVYTNGQYHN